MNPEERFSNMGFAQAGPDVWFREFIHPETESRLEVTARLYPAGKVGVLIKRDGRVRRVKEYTRSVGLAANAVRMAVERAGFQI